jgi:hypothetical protein
MELARLHDPKVKPLDAIEVISLATKRTHLGHHLGVIYRDPNATLRLIHLAWHYDLRDEPAPKSYFWIDMRLDPDIAPLVAELCTLIARKYKGTGLAYSIRPPGDRFDLTTGALLTPKGRGFTCATFVTTLFGSVGCPLIKEEEWMPREEDREWLEQIICALEEGGADPQHIEAERADLPCVRFRPEEVAAAGTSSELPVGFAYATRVGREIVERLRT